MKAISLVFALLFTVAGANAALIKSGDIITDTGTGLDWKALTATVNISYNQMIANFSDANSVFFGFRYATLDEVQGLFIGQGYTEPFGPITSLPSSVAAIQTVFDFFGQTGDNCCARGDGMYLNENGGLVDILYYIPSLDGSPGNTADDARVARLNNRLDPDAISTGGTDNLLGSWIVDAQLQTVPVPNTLALLLASLMAVGLLRSSRLHSHRARQANLR